MLVIEELVRLVKKKGFVDTLQVLTSFKNYKADKHAFYNALNKFSYYNSFFRIKEELLDRGLIKMEANGSKKYIILTEKGLSVYNKLVEVNKLILTNHIKN